MPTGSKGSKLLRYIEHRLRVSLVDGRTIVGTFLAFDKHLNLVLVDAEEYRYAKKSSRSSSKLKSSAIIEERVEKRTLGLIILRGENVVSVAVDGPPPPSTKAASATSSGPGVARGVGRGALPPTTVNGGGAGRGYGGAPMGLGAAPVHGVGGMGMPPPLPPGGMGMMPPPPPGMMGRGMPPPGMGRGGGY